MDIDYYHAVYGFVIKGKIDNQYDNLDCYVGYLASLHDVSNGGNYFSITFEKRGMPDWVDGRGHIHTVRDAWTDRIGRKCIRKLNLTYSLITLDLEDADEDYINTVVDDGLITNELFYYELDFYWRIKGVKLLSPGRE